MGNYRSMDGRSSTILSPDRGQHKQPGLDRPGSNQQPHVPPAYSRRNRQKHNRANSSAARMVPHAINVESNPKQMRRLLQQHQRSGNNQRQRLGRNTNNYVDRSRYHHTNVSVERKHQPCQAIQQMAKPIRGKSHLSRGAAKMTWHGYLGLINTGLAKGERDTLKALVKQLGPSQDRDPSRINHSRERLDGAGILIVAAFEEGEIDEDGFKARLETITRIGGGGGGPKRTKNKFCKFFFHTPHPTAQGDQITPPSPPPPPRYQ